MYDYKMVKVHDSFFFNKFKIIFYIIKSSLTEKPHDLHMVQSHVKMVLEHFHLYNK